MGQDLPVRALEFRPHHLSGRRGGQARLSRRPSSPTGEGSRDGPSSSYKREQRMPDCRHLLVDPPFGGDGGNSACRRTSAFPSKPFTPMPCQRASLIIHQSSGNATPRGGSQEGGRPRSPRSRPPNRGKKRCAQGRRAGEARLIRHSPRRGRLPKPS
jgi:hypothetical protein